jgi:hypothetical protein
VRFEDDRYDPVHDGLNPADVLDPVELCEYRQERAARARRKSKPVWKPVFPQLVPRSRDPEGYDW